MLWQLAAQSKMDNCSSEVPDNYIITWLCRGCLEGKAFLFIVVAPYLCRFATAFWEKDVFMSEYKENFDFYLSFKDRSDPSNLTHNLVESFGSFTKPQISDDCHVALVTCSHALLVHSMCSIK